MLKQIILLLFPVVLASSTARVESKIYVEGGDVSIKNEATAIAGEKKVSVSSTEQGEISIEVKDGKINITKSPESRPTIVITSADHSQILIKSDKIDQNLSINKEAEPKSVLAMIRGFLVKFFTRFNFGKKKT